MNSRDRFLTALKGKEPDRPPIAHVSALTTVELQDKTNCHMPEVHHEPEKLIRLLFANHEVLGFDAVTFIINYFNEPAALGCQIRWGSNKELPMVNSNPWTTLDDAFVPDDLLDKEPIQVYIKAIRLAKEKYGDKIAVLGKVMGPFSMVLAMHGTQQTMITLAREPDKIKRFLDIATDILISCGNAQFEVGIDALAIGEGGAGGNVLSPRMHEGFLIDSHRRMVGNISGPTVMHICGDITPRLHLLDTIGLTCFNFDWAIKPHIMKVISKGKFTIMGNINTYDLLRAKSEVIKRQVIENLEAGVNIISPGCAISPECPNTNLKVITKTINEWIRSH